MGSNNSKPSKSKKKKTPKETKRETQNYSATDNGRQQVLSHVSQNHTSSSHSQTTTIQTTFVTRTRSESVVCRPTITLPALPTPPHTISKSYTSGPSQRISIPPRGPFAATYEKFEAKPYRSSPFNLPGPSGASTSSHFTFNSPNVQPVSPRTPHKYNASPRTPNRYNASPRSPPPANDLIIPPSYQDNIFKLEESTKALTINVKKNGKRYDTNANAYKTYGNKRGMALIINNIKFRNDDSKTRNGAEVDEQNLTNLFKKLNIAPKTKRNLKSTEMQTSLVGFARDPNLKNVDMMFVVIMSHGTGTVDTITEIAGTDHSTIKVSDVTQCFANKACPQMRGKPKIFIFQCCRGEHENKDQHDAVPFQPLCEDMLLAYATLPGFVAIRNVETGSYYIQAICKVFMEHACDTHISDMLIMVQQALKKQLQGSPSNSTQTSSYENRGFKFCFLHPV